MMFLFLNFTTKKKEKLSNKLQTKLGNVLEKNAYSEKEIERIFDLLSEEDFELLQNGDITAQDLFDRCDFNTQKQTDMWGGDEENYFDWEEA